MNPEFLVQQGTVEKMTDPSDLMQVKQLDDLAFGVGPGIVGISMEELEHISQHGAVFAYTSPMGMLAETQVITEPIPEHPCLEKNEAYCYGTAVRPDMQDMGLGQLMYALQEQWAKDHNKEQLTLTVRVENAASLRARLKFGFVITGYDPTCYGPFEEGGARLWMTKYIAHPGVFEPEKLAASMLAHTLSQDVMVIPVQFGLGNDLAAHAAIQSLISDGYIGVGLLKPSELSCPNKNGALIFQKNI